MPRQPRERSATGIYHIMLRGIDKRKIFMGDGDNRRFLNALISAKENGKFELYGYCLMKNHVHLLMKEVEEDIGDSIKRITVSYVQWHNAKYGRVGHLFQNRFASETVNTEDYLLTVLRYIHQNPVKANMCNRAGDYQWSSYQSYIDGYDGKFGLIDTYVFLDYFANKQSFGDYMNNENDDKCLEYEEVKKYTDEELIQEINNLYTIKDIAQIKEQSDLQEVFNIYNNFSTSIRQLSRVLGMGKSVVEKAIKLEENTSQ